MSEVMLLHANMEPEKLGQKSSNEILTELFSAFNAEPPKEEELKVKSDQYKKHKKSKKSKKKHKSKKRRRDNDNELNADSRPHKKHKTAKVKVPIEELPTTLDILLENEFDVDPLRRTNEDTSKLTEASERATFTQFKSNGLQETKNQELTIVENENVCNLPVKSKEDDKKKGKIQISNLKNSLVFQETLRAIEEKKKEEEMKKASYEEGEISDSDSSKKDIAVSPEETEVLEPSRTSSKKHKSRSSKDSKRRKRSRSKSPVRHESSRSDRRSSREKRHRERHERDSSERHGSSSLKKRTRSRDRHSSRSRDHSKHSSSREKERRRSKTRSRSRSQSSSKSVNWSFGLGNLDKKKLLAIARKNALKLIDAGVVPGSDKVASIKSGGKTVSELTEYCKKLSKKEADGCDLSDINSDSSDNDDAFHHPFQVRDRPNTIVMNIKNATPLPVRSLQEKAAEQSKQLRMQFPVSSGSSHRLTESEWVPVEPKKEQPKLSTPILQPQLPKPAPMPQLPPPLPPLPVPVTKVLPPADLSAVPPPLPPSQPVFPVIQPTVPDLSCMPTANPNLNLDISAIVSKRLNAMRKLQENPNDSTAITEMTKAQSEMQNWAERRTELGAFTGSTGAKFLSAAELSSGAQAWAKRDQLTAARPVKGGMGMTLLQKMGWQPGEGLGKNKEGTLEPLKLEIKTDKKGLVATDEAWRVKGKQASQVGPATLPTVKTLDGKHPVSLLNELCNKRKWGQPVFELAFECGPDHKKNFLFKVRVNGKEYKPNVASANKKQAKAEAAAICLRALGLLAAPTTE